MGHHLCVLIVLFLEAVLVSGLCPSASLVEEPTKKKCYFLSQEQTNWADAKANCERQGAILAKVEDSTDHEFLKQNMVQGRFYWFGMNDLDTEDTFVWTDGRPVTNFQWRDQQPNGGTAQNCVTYDENTQWQDKDCDNVYYFICELSTFRQGLFRKVDSVSDVNLLGGVRVVSVQVCVLHCLQTYGCLSVLVDLAATQNNCLLLQTRAGSNLQLPNSPTVTFYSMIT